MKTLNVAPTVSHRQRRSRAALTLGLLAPMWTVIPISAQQGTAPPLFCGKTYVFSKAVPDGNVVANQPATVTVETYHFFDLIAHVSVGCPPPPYTVTMSASLNCTPGPSSGPTVFGPFVLAEDVKTVFPIDVPIPAGPPRVCDLVITSTVTLSDGSQISQTADQVISVVDPASGQPNTPRITIQLLGGGTVSGHPGDQGTFSYVITNNDPTASYTGTLDVDMRNVAGLPTNVAGPDDTAVGPYALHDPGDINHPPIEDCDNLAAGELICLENSIAITDTLISRSIFLNPAETQTICVKSRWWNLANDGAAAESTALVTGTYSDATSATCAAGATWLCDHDNPPDAPNPAARVAAAVGVDATGPGGPAAGLSGDPTPDGSQPTQINFVLDTSGMDLIVNGNSISSGNPNFSAVIRTDDQLCTRNDEWSFILPRAPPDAVIVMVTPVDVVPDAASLGNDSILRHHNVVPNLPTGYDDRHPYAYGRVDVFGDGGYEPTALYFNQQFSAVGVEVVTFNQVAMTNLGVDIQVVSPTRYVVTSTWTATNPGTANLIGFDVVSDYRGVYRMRPLCPTTPGDVNGDGVANGADVRDYVALLMSNGNSDCNIQTTQDLAGHSCADMNFNEVVDLNDTPTFIAALLGTDELYSTPVGPLPAVVSTDAGDQPATVEGHLKFTAAPPDALGRRDLTVQTFSFSSSSVPTAAGDTGGMTFLPRDGTVMGTWDLLRGRFDLSGDFDVGYPLAHENDPPAPLEPSGEENNDALISSDEFWTAFITAAAGVDVAGDINLDGELTAGVVQSITGRVDAVNVPISGFLVPRKTLGPAGCPIEHRCNKRILCVQPVFIRDDDGTNPTGSSLPALRAAADSIWERCCIEFDWKSPVFVNESDFKVIDNYVSPQGNSKILQLVSSHDVSASNGCVEVFFVSDIFIANPIRDSMGMTVFSGELQARIIVADALIDVCDPDNVNTLAHELGHAMGNENHSNDACLMDPQPGGPEPACPWYSPGKVSLDLCLSLSNPMLKEKNPKESCCKNPNCN